MQHSHLTGLLVVLGVLALTTVLGWWWSRRDGRVRPVAGDDRPTASDGARPPQLATLGVPAGVVTLVQFSSAFCAPCRATSRVLAEVEGHVDGLHVVEVDAEQHLDEVRALAIWRTPTVLVVDANGRITQRVSGVPASDELIAALRPLLAEAAR
ncbi:thioredoxin family protein [Micromonospora sp. WMMD710]|uniref:TlpA family protein disulfide reductase n=1 Tax=Micromonospora sp. WMMD710 TaxID=3016085 RepID=UPI002416F6B5|nr:thioredoxin family protein [Micromonospora sp. WMMD710]MDG4758500.1 thioredoxin family protein [Micromonospora sp. WMMD710]